MAENSPAQVLLNEFKTAIENDARATVAHLLSSTDACRQYLNQGLFSGQKPPLAAAHSRAMIDLLLQHGADPDKVSQWWASGFGLQDIPPDIGAYLVQSGARLTPHAAAGLGLVEDLHALIDQNPDHLEAKGGDGCTPLHFATSLPVARLLAARGAALDARDEDHLSTPAQWRISDAPEVTRFLLNQGARADIFMAAAFGDLDLAQQLIDADPACTTYFIGNNEGPFPGIGFQNRGGHIYQWSLGFNQTPHEVALQRGHGDLFQLLLARTPPKHQLLVACLVDDRDLALRLASENPDLLTQMEGEDLTLLAKLCWETNQNIAAVRLLLELGFPVDCPESNHGYSALHNAAWCGNLELVNLLLDYGHPVALRDPAFNGNPIGWACHSCLEAKRHPEENFPPVIARLLEAGTPCDRTSYPTGNADIDALLERHFEESG